MGFLSYIFGGDGNRKKKIVSTTLDAKNGVNNYQLKDLYSKDNVDYWSNEVGREIYGLIFRVLKNRVTDDHPLDAKLMSTLLSTLYIAVVDQFTKHMNEYIQDDEQRKLRIKQDKAHILQNLYNSAHYDIDPMDFKDSQVKINEIMSAMRQIEKQNEDLR